MKSYKIHQQNFVIMKRILSIFAIALLAISVAFTSCRNDASNAQNDENTEQAAPAEEMTNEEQAPAEDQATDEQEASNEAQDTTQAQ